MLRTDTQRLILELLEQEYRKAKFLKLYLQEIKEAKQNFIDHLKTLGVDHDERN